MKNSFAVLPVCLLLLGGGALAQQPASRYQDALPGYRYRFPRDHFSHPDFKTEWWYYTGNVKASDGRAFGFQLTFFRQAIRRSAAPGHSPWQIEDLYLAHAALSDLSAGKFYHAERLNRAGPGIAGVSRPSGLIWNGNWQVQWTGDRQKLVTITADWSVSLTLDSQKPPVIHGERGISRKGAAAGQASHYISLTRLAASGTIQAGGQSYAVQGTAWMDHEFFSNQLSADQAGWDWLSVQLDDRTELMLFRLRRKDGSIDPFSAGTYVDRDGVSRRISSREFSMTPLQRWTSQTTGASYPIRWQVSVPSLGFKLEIRTRLPEQEMTAAAGSVSPNYWEGAVEIAGTRSNAGVSGAGYLEMAGYDKPVGLGR